MLLLNLTEAFNLRVTDSPCGLLVNMTFIIEPLTDEPLFMSEIAKNLTAICC